MPDGRQSSPSPRPSCRAVIAGFFAIVLLILVLVGWCVWRFCRKKRPGKDKEKAEAAKEEDENALVDNEEIKDEDVRQFYQKVIM